MKVTIKINSPDALHSLPGAYIWEFDGATHKTLHYWKNKTTTTKNPTCQNAKGQYVSIAHISPIWTVLCNSQHYIMKSSSAAFSKKQRRHWNEELSFHEVSSASGLFFLCLECLIPRCKSFLLDRKLMVPTSENLPSKMLRRSNMVNNSLKILHCPWRWERWVSRTKGISFPLLGNQFRTSRTLGNHCHWRTAWSWAHFLYSKERRRERGGGGDGERANYATLCSHIGRLI